MNKRARPGYLILANGKPLDTRAPGRVISLQVSDSAGLESDSVQLELADHDPESPIEIPPTGAELEVFMGYVDEDDLVRMGLFVVDEVELGGWPSTMTITGRAAPWESSDRGKTQLQSQKVRAWPKGTKLGAMVAKIAKEHGLAPAVADSVAGIVLPQFDQTYESDISFLVRVVRKYDALVKPGGGKLVVVKRGEGKSASGESLPTITAQNCVRWSMTTSTRDSEGTVVAHYHDRAQAKLISVQVGKGDPVRRLRHSYPDRSSAEQAAQGELDKRERRKNQLSLTMPGEPVLTAEANLHLEGFREGVPTDWVISRVVHRIDTAGYVCNVEAESPMGD